MYSRDSLASRPRRARREGAAAAAGSDAEEAKQQGGWSSINNQAGMPYTPLGEPILDFVFQVKQRSGKGGSGSNNRGSGASGQQRSEQEEKEDALISRINKDDERKEKENAKKLPANSLDITDPVRDLLALCTPRRADVIDASAAIRERVALSDARIRTVRAGGTFDSIDQCLQGQNKVSEFQRRRKEMMMANGGPTAATAAGQQAEAASNGAAAASGSSALSPDALGSRLMQSTFVTLAKMLNDSSVSLHSPAGVLAAFQKQRLGAPFRPNFEGNAFVNLPAHPLLAPPPQKDETEEQRKEKQKQLTFQQQQQQQLGSQRGSQADLMLSRTGSVVGSPFVSHDPTPRAGGDGEVEDEGAGGASDDAASDDGAEGGQQEEKEQAERYYDYPPKHMVSSVSPGALRRTLPLAHPKPRTAPSALAYPHLSPLSATTALPSSSPSSSSCAPFVPTHHPHAPPSSLTFHALRYTLHQSFGTRAHQSTDKAKEKEIKARKDRRRRKERADRALSGTTGEAAAGGAASAPSSPTRGNNNMANTMPLPPMHPLSGSSTARSSGSRRGRRRHRNTGDGGGGDFSSSSSSSHPVSSSNPDRDYNLAVSASKFRREHNNSPTSHWCRLQENVQQRYAQARALSNMAYFAEGNLFQQGGLLTKEEERNKEREREANLTNNVNSTGEFGNAAAKGAMGSPASTARYPGGMGSPLSSPRGGVGAGVSGTGHGGTASTLPRGGPHAHSIHSGQILRQVSNQSWGNFLDPAAGAGEAELAAQGGKAKKKDNATNASGSGGGSDDPYNSSYSSSGSDLLSESSITKRAELTLARCYADFDLAKKDLKERLYESLALMDSERGQTLLEKYKDFAPSFVSAEQDILSMRLRPEKRRYNLLQERLQSLEKLYELIGHINQSNGGSNGAPGSGLVGFVHLASLPTFEEIYFVEVVASLIDSGIPMLASHRGNQLGDKAEKQNYEREDAEVKVGKLDDPHATAHAMQTAGSHVHGGVASGIHPALFAMHGASGSSNSGSKGSSNAASMSLNPAGSPSSSGGTGVQRSRTGSVVAQSIGGGSGTAAASTLASRRTSVIGSTPSGGGGGLPLHSHMHLPLPYSSVRGVSLIPPHTPTPAFLLLLLCLAPSVLKLKEVREALEKWARLCGVSEEACENALRMVGVDPRLATYSGRGAMKSSGAGAGGQLSAAQMLLLSEGAGGLALDAGTKNALLKSAAGLSLLPPAPVSRPLSSVLLSPVSLGDWEGRKQRERVKQSARDLERRVKAVRELTVSSNASTRIALGLGAKGSSNSGQQNGRMQGGSQTARMQQAADDDYGAAMMQSARGVHASPRRATASTLHSLPEEMSIYETASPRSARHSLQAQQQPGGANSARAMPKKHTTGQSKTFSSQQEREEKMHLQGHF